jgi:hypothetical protein
VPRFAVAVAVLNRMMIPHQLSGQLFVLEPHRPLTAWTDGDQVVGVVVRTRISFDAEDDHPWWRFRRILRSINIGQLIASIDHSWDTRDQIRAKVGDRLPELKRRASQTNEFLVSLH